jgi:hypothetical protein
MERGHLRDLIVTESSWLLASVVILDLSEDLEFVDL